VEPDHQLGYVDRALPDRGDEPPSGFPAFGMGHFPADLLGSRHAGGFDRVLRAALSCVRAPVARDLDFRDAVACARSGPRGTRKSGGGSGGDGVMAAVYGVMAEFPGAEALLAAVRQARAAGYRDIEAYSPFPVEGLAEALGF